MTKLNILVATTDTKILKNDSFFQLPFDENFSAVVVNQKIENSEDLIIESPFIQVINSKEKGISNSRNLALAHAKADYVHFCDDDVTFMPDYLNIIQQSVAEFPTFDFFRFQIETPDGAQFKEYDVNSYEIRSNSLINRRKILFISSVELVGKLKTIQEKKLQFNPQFGVGSGDYPMGEEALFLFDALEKGCSLQYIPKAIVSHPKESSGKKLGKEELRTLGVLFRKVYGWFTPLFNGYYALKKRNILKDNELGIWDSIKILNNGK